MGPRDYAVATKPSIPTVERRRLLANVRDRGAQLRAGLEKLATKFDFIREIRGEGLMLGMELDIDGAPYVAGALEQGLLINCTHDKVLRFLPPFILTARQVKEGLSKLESVFAKIERPAKLQAVTSSTTAQALTLAAAR